MSRPHFSQQQPMRTFFFIFGFVGIAALALRASDPVTKLPTILSPQGAQNPDIALSVKDLIRALKDNDRPVYVRGNASRDLGKLGPVAKEAIPQLRQLLKTGDSYTRQQAAVALWRIDNDTNVIPLLVSELRQVRVRVAEPRFPTVISTCMVTLEAFGEMGSLAKSAEPVIIDVMNHAQEIDRAMEKQILIAAHDALAKIDPELNQALAPP
jgi:HEAT repeat protein